MSIITSIRNISSNNSNALPVKTVNNQEAPMINETELMQQVFDARRTFVPQGWDVRLSMTEEQIEAMSCRNIVLRLFSESRIRISQNANGSRKDATPVLFPNAPQYDQIARSLAIYENIPLMAQAVTDTQGYKQVALLDTKGNHDVIVYEKQGEDGWIDYSVFYANKQYNQHGQVIGLNESAEDPIQDWLRKSIEDGYEGFDGVRRESHNQWIRRYNAAVIAVANGTATDEQKAMLKNVTEDADPNRFVQINSRREVKWESVANKYAVLSWLLLDVSRPAFEIYNRTKTVESNTRFIDGMIKMMERGYRNQLRSLSGLYKNNAE